jgi:hypothetical protein
MPTQKEQKLSDKTQEVENLMKELPEEVKIAAEAMKRTMRYRRTRLIQPRQYAYKQIF